MSNNDALLTNSNFSSQTTEVEENANQTKILTFNARSLNINATKETILNHDIAIITESGTDQKKFKNLQANFEHSKLKHKSIYTTVYKKGIAGVTIYIKPDIISEIHYEENDDDLHRYYIIMADLKRSVGPTGCLKSLIVGAYAPTNAAQQHIFFSKLYEKLDKIENFYRPDEIIFGGDFNISIDNKGKCSQKVFKIIDQLKLRFNLQDLYRFEYPSKSDHPGYTWHPSGDQLWTKSSSRIDYIYHSYNPGGKSQIVKLDKSCTRLIPGALLDSDHSGISSTIHAENTEKRNSFNPKIFHNINLKDEYFSDFSQKKL